MAAGAAAVVVVLALTAITGQWTHGLKAVPADQPTSTSIPDERTFLLPPDADQRIYYSGIRSDPLPTPAPKPAVDSAAAISTVRAGGPDGTPAATLRMISSPGGLSGIPTSPEPYWVITWDNTPPGRIGGPVRPTTEFKKLPIRKVPRTNPV